MVSGPASIARKPCASRSSSSSRSSFQKVMNFFGSFSIMVKIERGRHVSEPFAHPLIAIGTEAHRMSPPLMRNFVRGHHFPVTAVAPIHSQLMAYGRVKVIADRNPDQLRP